MFPHERALVRRYAGRPFAIIGVNSDPDRTQANQQSKEAGVTWRSFWNGPLSTRGPIAARWKVTSWPTLYVLDQKGIIRHKWRGNPGEKELDEKLEALVKDAEQSGAGERGGQR